MRTQNIWVNSDDVKDNGYTYVMPKNLLKKFVCIADLKTQIFGYMYGSTVEGLVREIKCIVIVPQVGNRDIITIPSQTPESEFLKGLEPVGWIHTCPEDKNFLTLPDAAMHAKFINNNSNWQIDKTMILNVGFTPGSISLTAYKINLPGYEWLRANKDTNPNPASFTNAYYEKTQLLLS